jgi:rare lipoprotein A (peptidoglycan hydrolase)
MSPALAQRQVALAGVALLGTLGAIALGRADGSAEPIRPATPTAAWEQGRVALFGQGREGEQTACGVTLGPEVRGIAHPVLPCGVPLILAREGREARGQVIERGTVEGGRTFDLTEALAAELGVQREATIRWRFAR